MQPLPQTLAFIYQILLFVVVLEVPSLRNAEGVATIGKHLRLRTDSLPSATDT